MQLPDTLASLLRRWRVVVIGVLLTFAAGWTAYAVFPAKYDAAASIVVMPAASIVGDDGNPYLYLSGMNDALDVLIRRTNSTEVQEELLEDLKGASYALARDPTTTSPIFVIEVEAGSEADARGLLDAVITASSRNLATMQDDLTIPEDRRISLRAVAVDDQAIRDGKAPLQVGLVVIGAGLFGTIMAAGIIDGFLLRRQRDIDGDTVAPPADAGSVLPPTATHDDHDDTAPGPLVWPATPEGEESAERSSPWRPTDVSHDLLEPQRR